MAQVDTSIYNALMQPARGPLDYANEFARNDALRNQNALTSMQVQQAVQANEARNGIRNALAGLGSQATLDQQIGTLRSLGTPESLTQADTLDTAQQNRVKAAAQANKDNAEAGKSSQETLMSKRQQHFSDLATVNTPEDALAWGAEGVRLGIMSPDKFPQAVQALQQAAQTPEGFAQWKQQAMNNALTAQEQLKLQTPTPTEVRLGNVVKTIDMNPHSASFGKEVVPQQAIGVSPDTVATQAGENERAAKSREVQLKLGGYDANGNLIGGDASGGMSGLVDSIGQYKSPESVALSRVPPALKSQVMAQVMQKYPDYDPSTYGAKQKAARDFSTGTQGNSMRSFAVAGQHLDQLGTLVDALDNGNAQLVNKIGNAYSTATGNPAPTNFDAAKDVVSKEVVKAIVAGGGGVAEREELSRLMDNAKSPAQLKGVIQQYRNLMGAQHDALLQQRRAAGLPDSTLPNYGDSAPAAAPTGAFKITHIDGKPQ